MASEMGVTLHSGDMTTEELVRYVQEAESLGYEGFWLTEESGKEAFSMLTLLAQATRRIRLATGIVNFYSRTPTLLAMSARTLHDFSGGRFALGIGTGGIGFMERGHGLAIERPLGRARETVEIVRGLLTSNRFSYDGTWFHVREFRLREGPVAEKIPIYLSALNPKMVGLAARIADGFIANWPTEEAIEEWKTTIRREAESVGRDPQEVRIFTLMMTCADPHDEQAVNAMRRGLAFYCASPHYHHIAEISGFGAQAKKVYEVWQTGDFDAATRLVSDAMAEKFSLTGSVETCRKRLRALLDAGVYPIIYPLPRRDRKAEDHTATIRLAMSYLS
ncbi:MAG: LLM class flavin-dependent oxidoreductase [Acidobacteria bacterium]|nr:LLM class flavin-dependent oxidoreductase [Acidobacteriota bacterium]